MGGSASICRRRSRLWRVILVVVAVAAGITLFARGADGGALLDAAATALLPGSAYGF